MVAAVKAGETHFLCDLRKSANEFALKAGE
jgi:hypothetical protein